MQQVNELVDKMDFGLRALFKNNKSLTAAAVDRLQEDRFWVHRGTVAVDKIESQKFAKMYPYTPGVPI